MTFIATQIVAQEEKQDLIKTFEALDADGNGVLTQDELILGNTCGVDFGHPLGYMKVYNFTKKEAEKEALKIIKSIDLNNSGEIDFFEFIVAAMQQEQLLSKQKMEAAFNTFDINGDGFITREEIV